MVSMSIVNRELEIDAGVLVVVIGMMSTELTFAWWFGEHAASARTTCRVDW